MGLCHSAEYLHLCILNSNYIHTSDFQFLCETHQITIIEINENKVTVNANKKQLKILKKYCKDIYSVNYPLYYSNAYSPLNIY